MKADFLSLPFFLHSNSLKELEGTEITNGRLNRISLFTSSSGDIICVRKMENIHRDFVVDYLLEMHTAIGFRNFGGYIHLNTIKEQEEKIFSLKSKGICAPNVVGAGADWLAMSYIKGRTLANTISENATPVIVRTIRNYLDAVCNAHMAQEFLWDRSGSNEIIQENGEVFFIDFDIDIRFPSHTSPQVIAAYDLSTCIRTCLRFAADKEAAHTAISLFLSQQKSRQVYDYHCLRKILVAQCHYYDEMIKNQEYKEYYEADQVINYYIRGISNDLTLKSPSKDRDFYYN